MTWAKMTEFLAQGSDQYLAPWPRGQELCLISTPGPRTLSDDRVLGPGVDDRVLGPGVLKTEGQELCHQDRVPGPGVLMTEFLAQGY